MNFKLTLFPLIRAGEYYLSVLVPYVDIRGAHHAHSHHLQVAQLPPLEAAVCLASAQGIQLDSAVGVDESVDSWPDHARAVGESGRSSGSRVVEWAGGGVGHLEATAVYP